MVSDPFKLGSIWRAKSCFAKVDTIKIVGRTDDRRVLLVEWVDVGSELRMTAESILYGYTPDAGPDPAVGLVDQPPAV